MIDGCRLADWRKTHRSNKRGAKGFDIASQLPTHSFSTVCRWWAASLAT